MPRQTSARRPASTGPPMPPPHVVTEVMAREITDYDALIRWWQTLEGEHRWLQRLPADLAVRMAVAGCPPPHRLTGGMAAEAHQ